MAKNRRLIYGFASAACMVSMLSICGFGASQLWYGSEPRVTRIAPVTPGLPDIPASPGSNFRMEVGASVQIRTEAQGAYNASVSLVEWRKTPCSDYGSVPRNAFLVATVEIVVTSGTASVNPLYWSLVDSAGVVQDSISGMAAGCDTLTTTDQLPAGMRRSGTVSFDAAATPGLELVLSSGLGRPIASWRVT